MIRIDLRNNWPISISNKLIGAFQQLTHPKGTLDDSLGGRKALSVLTIIRKK